jgi:hypothetical protein
MIVLGSKVKDSISGFKGIATGRCEYLYGCAQILIQAERLNKDGSKMDGEWIDEQRIEVIAVMKPKISKDSSAISGGPQQNPKEDRYNS